LVNVADSTATTAHAPGQQIAVLDFRDCEDLGVGEEARLLMAQQTPERPKKAAEIRYSGRSSMPPS